MSVTPVLVWVDKNKLVYECTSGGSPIGGEGTIPSAGGATPDLATDVANDDFGEAGGAALRRACRSGLDGGNGTPLATAWTQAQARALLLCNAGAAAVNSIGGINTARLQCRLVAISGIGDWSIDADVDGSGRPEINITSSVDEGVVQLHVELLHSISL